MSWDRCDVFCIYPDDQSTRFLDRIVSYLKASLSDSFHCFKVKPNEQSHAECLEKLSNIKNKLIIYLGHGRSDMLFGSFGKNAGNEFVSDCNDLELSQFYCKEDFITRGNCKVLSTNRVIALSCNSNESRNSIGQSSIFEGCKTFVGFGDIPTDYDTQVSLSLRDISIFKGILVKVVKLSLSMSIIKGFTVEQWVDLLKIFVNKEILILRRENSKLKNRYKISRQLYFFKEEIIIYGMKHEPLISC